jgi:hypothetical protein
MQVGDHMQVILFRLQGKGNALPAASTRPISTTQGRIIFWKDGLMLDMISASRIIWDNGNCERHGKLHSGLEILRKVAGTRFGTSCCREVSFWNLERKW